MLLILKKLIGLCLLLYFVSITLLGNFDAIIFGQAILTKISVLFLFVFSFLVFFINEIKLNKYFVILFFVLGLIYLSLTSALNGTNVNQIINEVSPYIIPLFCFSILQVFSHREFNEVKSKILIVILIYAVIHIVVALSSLYTTSYYSLAYYLYNDWSNSQFKGDVDNSFIFLRVQFGYSFVLLYGLYLSLERVIYERSMKGKLCSLILFFGILATQSRAMILTVLLLPIFFFCINFIFSFKLNRVARAFLLFSSLILPSILIAVSIYLDPLQYINLSRGGADDLRLAQLNSFLDGFVQSPWFGIGVGNSFELIRSYTTPWIYELNIIAIFFKIGVLGFLFLAFFIFSFLLSITQTGIIKGNSLYSLSVSFLFIMVLSANSNPYLANLAGTGILMMLFSNIGFIEVKYKEIFSS